MSKLRASRNTFQESLNKAYYFRNVNPPKVRTSRLSAEEVKAHFAKKSRLDNTVETRTEFDKLYLGL